jgi:signal transduction histidine kinase
MTDTIAAPHVPAPAVTPPRRFVERRGRSRREGDRVALRERALLARALDVLAAEGTAESRLAGLLDLLADTVGATRAAVVAEGPPRRIAVAASGAEDHAAAMALGRWLDAEVARSRAHRAAASPAPISVVARRVGRSPVAAEEACYATLRIPSAGNVTLGFAAPALLTEEDVAARLPPALARHAAVALALVSGQLATDGELAMLRAGEAERARFISTVAHELRTPLTGLSGYLDLILDGRVGDAGVEREFLERGRAIVASMAALVGDLLELSRLESGTLTLERGPFSVAEALGEVAAGIMPIALARGLDLRVDAPPRMRAATGDRRRVVQVLTNLAANALKFGGGGTAVELAGRFTGSAAILAVRDEGPGIAADDRARIFERFYRMADHERVDGTGLGLPIARDLARAMGGDLDVASVPGIGSAFVLVLGGPAGPLEAGQLERAMREAMAEETDGLVTLAALRAAGSTPPSSRGTGSAAARLAVGTGS